MPTYYSFEGDDTFYTWEEIHNLGYTNHPTEQIDIKSIAQWGGIEDLGLMDLGGEARVTPIQAEYWINDGGRWYSLNELAQAGFYPGIANDNVIVNNGSIQCYTAILYGELQHPYYLIEKAPELGWLNETEFSENGWVIGELPDQNKTFYVLDAVTGEELNSTKGVVDHLVCDRYNILEDGGVQHIDVPINSIEIFLGLSSSNGSFAAHTFSTNDYWGSCVLDQSDKSILEDFGISLIEVSSGLNISSSNTSNFTFEVLGLYSGMRTGELNADLSNFSAEPKGGWSDRICICSVNAYNQNVMTWKCRITKN
jgi:hypothetical protein